MRPRRVLHKPTHAPEWMVTFGDMMALLLCFFILLQMLSETKKDREYQRVVTGIKEAFGFSGRIGLLPVDDVPLRSLVERLEQLADNELRRPRASHSDDAGMAGPHVRVAKVREGVEFAIGGPGTFEPASADVSPDLEDELGKLAVLLKGRRNAVEIRGHAARKYLAAGSPWSDLDDLSYARARRVRDVLARHGVDPGVMRLVAVGDREPARPRPLDPLDRAENRRVEIILTEALVEDMTGDPRSTDPTGARGGRP